MSGPLNYTTSIAASKTITEMQELLREAGAGRVAVEYEGGAIAGLSFVLVTPHGERHFALPLNVDAMHRLLVDKGRRRQLGTLAKSKWESVEHAERVACRVLKDWLAAQLTLVATQMAQLDEVMLPYLHIDPDHTLYAAYRERESIAALTTKETP